MTPRHKRFMLAGIVLGGAAVGVTLVLNAFNSNLVFFYSPTDVQRTRRRRTAPSAWAAWSRPAASSASPTA
jgi:cytochrome c-type biogenesis protein CcmE